MSNFLTRAVNKVSGLFAGKDKQPVETQEAIDTSAITKNVDMSSVSEPIVAEGDTEGLKKVAVKDTQDVPEGDSRYAEYVNEEGEAKSIDLSYPINNDDMTVEQKKYIQTLIGVDPDGDFGDLSKAALAKYRKDHDIPTNSRGEDFTSMVLEKYGIQTKDYSTDEGITRYLARVRGIKNPTQKQIDAVRKEKGNLTSNEFTSGGDVSKKLVDAAGKFLPGFAEVMGGENITITGGKDAWHVKNRKSSKHNKGTQMDMVVKGASGGSFDGSTKPSGAPYFNAIKQLGKQGFKGPTEWSVDKVDKNGKKYKQWYSQWKHPNGTVINDEYKYPHKSATGGHFHFNGDGYH